MCDIHIRPVFTHKNTVTVLLNLYRMWQKFLSVFYYCNINNAELGK